MLADSTLGAMVKWRERVSWSQDLILNPVHLFIQKVFWVPDTILDAEETAANYLTLFLSSRTWYSGEGGTGEQAVVKHWTCVMRRVSKGCSRDTVLGGYLTSSGWSGRLPGEVRVKLRPSGGQLKSGSVRLGCIGRHGWCCQLGG